MHFSLTSKRIALRFSAVDAELVAVIKHGAKEFETRAPTVMVPAQLRQPNVFHHSHLRQYFGDRWASRLVSQCNRDEHPLSQVHTWFQLLAAPIALRISRATLISGTHSSRAFQRFYSCIQIQINSCQFYLLKFR